MRQSIALFVCISFLATDAAPSYAACGFSKAFTRPDEKGKVQVQVFEGMSEPALGGARALAFVSSLKVNTDGTSRSYHVRDPRAQKLAINDMRNAMRSGSTIADFEAIAAADWTPVNKAWSIVSASVIEKDKLTGKPCVTAEGFMVSMTSDFAVNGASSRMGDCDQKKWIDALVVPALVLPKPNPSGSKTQFDSRGAGNRSAVVAMTLDGNDRLAFGIVGDRGPANELGEASVEMNRMLNGLPAGTIPTNYSDAKARFQAPRSVVLIFPGQAARMARPIDAGIPGRVKTLFDAWGGAERLKGCLSELGA